MNWYYVDNGQQAGPVDDAQLEALRSSGTIQPDTLIWSEGMANWQAYAEVKGVAAPGGSAIPVAPPLAASPTAAAAGSAVLANEAVCAECGRVFPSSEVIRYGDKAICATCKPVFFQRVREGAGFAGGAGGATEAELLARDYQVDIGESFSRGWEVFKANAGILIGASILVYLCLFALNIIPYLSIILSLMLTGPLMGGLWYLYVKAVRNQGPELGDAFSGFGPRFWQLVLVQIIPGILAAGVFFFGAMAAALLLPALAAAGRGNPGLRGGSPMAAVLVPVGIVVFIGLLVLIYLNTCWMFALPLVRDKGLKFWPAMQLSRRVVCKHWWMTFWLMVVAGLFAMLGVLGCGVGLLLTGPVAFAMVSSHYQKVFGDLVPNRD